MLVKLALITTMPTRKVRHILQGSKELEKQKLAQIKPTNLPGPLQATKKATRLHQAHQVRRKNPLLHLLAISKINPQVLQAQVVNQQKALRLHQHLLKTIDHNHHLQAVKRVNNEYEI